MNRKATAFAALAALYCSIAFAEAKVTTVLDNLDNPSGVAIQPETGHIFVSDSGAGRVIRLVDGKAEDVIIGFKTDIYGKGPMYNIGPLGLLFLNRDTLVVGGGDLPDGQEQLRTFAVPAVGQKPVSVEDATSSLGLPAEEGVLGEGNFYDLALIGNAVFVTSNGDDTKGWVAKAIVKDGKLASFERSIATKVATNVDAPVGATVSPRGELVIGQMGEVNKAMDALLTFYNPKDGNLLLNLPAGLNDITDLAYTADKNHLLALDFAWIQPDQGGLFELIVASNQGKQGVKARKIVSLDKPSAMAVAKDGAIFVTLFGTAQEGSNKKPGSLVRIEMTN